MEEEELEEEEEAEIVFKHQKFTPDIPSTPASDDREVDQQQNETVLQMVKTVRDQIKALVLDNSNIRAACDELRKQCHIQGVAFADLSRMVNQSREDQDESRTFSNSPAGPQPHMRQELLDSRGNLRAQDIGISWRDGETFLHGVRIAGHNSTGKEELRQPMRAKPYPSCQRDKVDAFRQPVMSTPYQQSRDRPPVNMSTPGCIEMSDTPASYFAAPRQDGRPTHRQHPYNGLTARILGGRRGFVTSERWLMFRDGTRTSGRCRWSHT